jgi:hypothetical protein
VHESFDDSDVNEKLSPVHRPPESRRTRQAPTSFKSPTLSPFRLHSPPSGVCEETKSPMLLPRKSDAELKPSDAPSPHPERLTVTAPDDAPKSPLSRSRTPIKTELTPRQRLFLLRGQGGQDGPDGPIAPANGRTQRRGRPSSPVSSPPSIMHLTASNASLRFAVSF